jgi:hypothetical protein
MNTTTLYLTQDELIKMLNGQDADWYFGDEAHTVITTHSDLGNASTGPMPQFETYEPNADGLYEIEVLDQEIE